ncbi:uncharacterized protein [Rutidosis leptorrhynchoides]
MAEARNCPQKVYPMARPSPPCLLCFRVPVSGDSTPIVATTIGPEHADIVGTSLSAQVVCTTSNNQQWLCDYASGTNGDQLMSTRRKTILLQVDKACHCILNDISSSCYKLQLVAH